MIYVGLAGCSLFGLLESLWAAYPELPGNRDTIFAWSQEWLWRLRGPSGGPRSVAPSRASLGPGLPLLGPHNRPETLRASGSALRRARGARSSGFALSSNTARELPFLQPRSSGADVMGFRDQSDRLAPVLNSTLVPNDREQIELRCCSTPGVTVVTSVSSACRTEGATSKVLTRH